MIYLIDSVILFDIFLSDPKYGIASKEMLQKVMAKGKLQINEIIYSELSYHFPKKLLLDQILDELNIDFEYLSKDSCYTAAQIFKHYRHQGGKRDKILPDFLIAAHGYHHCDYLLTRDRGFYRHYFPRLKILEP